MLKIIYSSENSVLIKLGNKIDNNMPIIIRSTMDNLQEYFDKNILEIVPSYCSILIFFKLNYIIYNHKNLFSQIKKVVKNIGTNPKIITDMIKIPVCYDESLAPDITKISKQNNITIKDIIKIHSNKTYQVFAVGFAPAFAYLGVVDEKIATARLDAPRTKIPAGSVAIANNQTAIYPVDSPAGWNIIGRTPIDLSLKKIKNLTKFNIADRVVFKPISLSEYKIIKKIQNEQ
ncbi:MAG: hypothetical protein DRQ51_08225 [Gammaproteobacteria bacterium]|nr:MAG: hypothetical protein DRQ51_08225 [Gammaproteobacteria bacterium]